MEDNDLFMDFTKNKVFDTLLAQRISQCIGINGLFGYTEFRSLERIYLSSNVDGRFLQETPEELSNSTLLKNYRNFINNAPTLRNLVRVLSIINERNTMIDHGITVGSWHNVSSWDLASNEVHNVGKEARLLIIHKILNHTKEDYMFNMVSDEYLRVAIDKYDRTPYSHEAVDLITSLPACLEDRRLVYLLLFAVYAFTCIKTYGHAETNTKSLAEVALQLCGTGITCLDYYFKRIYVTFKDVDLMVNYNLLSSIYGSEHDYAVLNNESIFALNLSGQFKHSFGNVLKRYLTLENSRYDVDNIYFKIIQTWKNSGVWAKGDIRKDVSYINRLTTKNTKADFIKTQIDETNTMIPHTLFSILKSIMDISPELDDNINLYDLPIMSSYAEDLFDSTGRIDLLRNLFQSELFNEMPAWKHALLILLYLNITCKLPIVVTKKNLTADIKNQVQFYYELYNETGYGKDYTYMLSP